MQFCFSGWYFVIPASRVFLNFLTAQIVFLPKVQFIAWLQKG